MIRVNGKSRISDCPASSNSRVDSTARNSLCEFISLFFQLITVHIQKEWERHCFHRCLFLNTRRGTPIQPIGGWGTPHTVGTPSSPTRGTHSVQWGDPLSDWMGYPPLVMTGWGKPLPGDRGVQRVLTMQRVVCLLLSYRRTILFLSRFLRYSEQIHSVPHISRLNEFD